MTTLNLDEDLIMYLYINKGMSPPKIAKKVGCSRTTICNRLKKLNIPIRSVNEVNSIYVDTDTIESLYNNGMTSTLIADKLGCSRYTVCRRLQKMGVPIKSAKDYPSAYTLALDENVIEDMYVSKRMSSRSIAKRIGCSSSTIIIILKKLNVDRRCPGEVKKMTLDEDLIMDLYVNKGMSATEISRIIGCSSSTIASRVIEHGIPIRPSGISGYIDDWTYGYPLKLGSGWEDHVYNVFLGKGKRKFLFQGEFGERKEYCTPKFILDRPKHIPKKYHAKTKDTYLWHPDFVIPELKIIIEVKGGWKGRQRWNQCIIPCLKATPNMDYRVYEMGVSPYDAETLCDLKKLLKRII